MKKAPFVAQVDVEIGPKLKAGLEDQGFALSKPPYTCFSGKKKGVSCTLYESGKLVVQGKDKGEFIEFYLEPEILGTFTYSHPAADIDRTPRIGGDEAGKGDFFGPLCIVATYANEDGIQALIDLGVADSKKLSDKKIAALAPKIGKVTTSHIMTLMPATYNQLYEKIGNLNQLLAWAHATCLEKVVEETGCREAIVDQFAYPHVLNQKVAQKKLNINLTQRVRGEEDIVVAAASMLARNRFCQAMDYLSKEYQLEIPKGAGAAVKAAGRQLISKHGRGILSDVCKLHFKTSSEL